MLSSKRIQRFKQRGKETAEIQGYEVQKRHLSDVPFWCTDSVSYNSPVALRLGFRPEIRLDQSSFNP